MTIVLGSPTPKTLNIPISGSVLPGSAGTYTDPTGAIIIPPNALDRWFAYRQTLGATKRSVVCFGDSTWYGSGGNYSVLQRLRDNASGVSTGGPAGFGIADGGKGIFAGLESGIVYDSPEVNGFVSSTFNYNNDSFDNLVGGYISDDGTTPGNTYVMQFRSTAARLWYRSNNVSGDFTYSIDGGAAVTVHAWQPGGVRNPIFTYISGLTAGVTHTITITNLGTSTGGGKQCAIAFAPVNATGVTFEKFCVSGSTIGEYFMASVGTPPWTQTQNGFRYQTAMGLVPTDVSSPNYTGAPVDTTYTAGAMAPVLAMSNLGFNDLSHSVDSTDLAMFTEYVKKFAGACSDAGCDGIIVSGQLPYNAQWAGFGPARFNALKTQALASGLGFVDLFYPIGGPSLSYAGGASNPHLTKAQYQTQADWLWNNLLGLAG